MHIYEEDEDDEVARIMAEYAEENRAKYGGQAERDHDETTEEDGQGEAPAATPRRVRIPTHPGPAAPAADQGSFEDQLAALTSDDGDDAPALTPIEPEQPEQNRGPWHEEQLSAPVIVSSSPTTERGKVQHRPGLRRAPRFLLTDEDERALIFLAAARYGTAHTVSLLLGKEEGTVARRLTKLADRGYLFKRHGAAAGALFSPTEFGLEEVDCPIGVEAKDFSIRAVKHTLAGANVLALLLAGTVGKGWADELLLPEHPVADHFLTEKQLHRAVSRQQALLNPRGVAWQWNAPSLRARKMKLQSEWADHRAMEGAREEVNAPWTFLLLPTPAPTKPSYHVPDLVLSYPRAKDFGESQAVAIEVELHAVNEEKLADAVMAYADEFESPWSSYAKVVWLCRDRKVAEAVLAAAKRLMPRRHAPRFKVLLLNETALTGVTFPDRQINLTPEQRAKRDANLSPVKFSRGLYKEERAALAAARAEKGGE